LSAPGSLPLTTGEISAVRGSVVEVRFAKDLPSVYTALRSGKKNEVVIEVLAQSDAYHVRGIALTPTEGLARGMLVENTGEPLKVRSGNRFFRGCSTFSVTRSIMVNHRRTSNGAPSTVRHRPS